ncbi:MAG: DoxX family membrane protein [Raineya sp.]
MKPIAILFIIVRLGLGGVMLYGGYQKFAKPLPPPTEMIEQVEKEGSAKLRADLQKLQRKNYIFGMKQTGFAWQLLGIAEIVGGLLLISQFLSLLGAALVLPVTLHIFLFHLFLEPNEVGELIETTLMFLANLAIIGKEHAKWKHLLWIKPA